MRKPAFILALVTAVVAAAFLLGIVQAQEKVLATVNGQSITEEYLEEYVQQRAAQGDRAGIDRQTLLEELVSRELIYQDALKKNIDEREEVKRQLEIQRRETVVGAAIRDRLDATPISDEQLRKQYDQLVSSQQVEEFKARHILSETEEAAKAIIEELDGGAGFAELARDRSTGPTAERGGDLGWFNPQQMVPEFAQAVSNMKTGHYSESPVKTQFGWHVILLEDRRDMTPPSFEEVKPQLQQMLMSEQVKDYVDELHNNADVTVVE